MLILILTHLCIERERLDKEFQSLVSESAVSFRPVKYDRSEDKDDEFGDDDFKDYDIAFHEMQFEGKVQPSDRTKSVEELAVEAKKKLEELEAARLKRMNIKKRSGAIDEDEEVISKSLAGDRGGKRKRITDDEIVDDCSVIRENDTQQNDEDDGEDGDDEDDEDEEWEDDDDEEWEDDDEGGGEDEEEEEEEEEESVDGSKPLGNISASGHSVSSLSGNCVKVDGEPHGQPPRNRYGRAQKTAKGHVPTDGVNENMPHSIGNTLFMS